MYCWVCDGKVDEFLPYGLPPRPGRCPRCGAKPRNRAMSWYLREKLAARLGPGRELLEVGPSRVAAKLHCEAAGAARYTAIDTRELAYHADIPAPHRYLRMDVTAMGIANDSIDVLLCNNVLPYVAELDGALAEIARCLKPGGVAMLNTPMDQATTCSVAQYRNANPQLGDDYFAENGDQWVCGRDLLARIEATGLRVDVEKPFAGAEQAFLRHNGLTADAEFVLAVKPPMALD